MVSVDGGFVVPSDGVVCESGGGRVIRNDCIVSVSCCSVLDCSSGSGNLMIGCCEVQQICILGKIISVVRQAMYVTVEVDDGTGVVSVRQWMDDVCFLNDFLVNKLLFCFVYIYSIF